MPVARLRTRCLATTPRENPPHAMQRFPGSQAGHCRPPATAYVPNSMVSSRYAGDSLARAADRCVRAPYPASALVLAGPAVPLHGERARLQVATSVECPPLPAKPSRSNRRSGTGIARRPKPTRPPRRAAHHPAPQRRARRLPAASTRWRTPSPGPESGSRRVPGGDPGSDRGALSGEEIWRARRPWLRGTASIRTRAGPFRRHRDSIPRPRAKPAR